MTPLEERFRQRLEIYKEQQTGVSKDKNLKKRIEKELTNPNDFQQQRQMDFAKVRNVASKIHYNTSGRILGYGQEDASGKVIFSAFRNNLGKYIPNKAPKSAVLEGNSIKALAPARRWTTSGYQSYGATPVSQTQEKAPVAIKNKKSLKERLMEARGFTALGA